jgi:hypothetical protein
MAQPPRTQLSPELILRLQTIVGNRAVQRLLAPRPAPAPMLEPPPKWASSHYARWWLWITACWRWLRRFGWLDDGVES